MKIAVRSILSGIRKKEVQEFCEDHIREAHFDEDKRKFSAFVDKSYSINALKSSQYLAPFAASVKSRFGKDAKIALHLKTPHKAHDREMLIPHSVHY